VKSTIMAVLFLVAASAYGALGDYDTFISSRDWSNKNGDGPLVNAGQSPCSRAYKTGWSEGFLADWDESVGENGGQSMLDWMTANPPAAGERYKFTLDLCTVMYDGWMIANPHLAGDPVRVEIRALNLGNGTDWAEGDGAFDGCGGQNNPLNWSPATMAACNSYAQASWVFVGYFPVLDVDNAVPWTAYDGTEFTGFENSTALFDRNINGVYDKNQNGSIDPDEQAAQEDFYMVIPTDDPLFAEGYFVQAELQYDPDHPNDVYPVPVVNDLLYNEDNRGLILGRTQYWNRDTSQWEGPGTGVGADFDNNGSVVSRDKDNEGQKPRIRIEIAEAAAPTPWPGDAQPDGKVDGGDYTIWADNYGKTDAPAWSAGGWTVGNFTEDANVDGGDYTVWADNYGYGTGGAPVPEPATLLVLAAGAAAVICRRRRS